VRAQPLLRALTPLPVQLLPALLRQQAQLQVWVPQMPLQQVQAQLRPQQARV